MPNIDDRIAKLITNYRRPGRMFMMLLGMIFVLIATISVPGLLFVALDTTTSSIALPFWIFLAIMVAVFIVGTVILIFVFRKDIFLGKALQRAYIRKYTRSSSEHPFGDYFGVLTFWFSSWLLPRVILLAALALLTILSTATCIGLLVSPEVVLPSATDSERIVATATYVSATVVLLGLTVLLSVSMVHITAGHAKRRTR